MSEILSARYRNALIQGRAMLKGAEVVPNEHVGRMWPERDLTQKQVLKGAVPSAACAWGCAVVGGVKFIGDLSLVYETTYGTRFVNDNDELGRAVVLERVKELCDNIEGKFV